MVVKEKSNPSTKRNESKTGIASSPAQDPGHLGGASTQRSDQRSELGDAKKVRLASYLSLTVSAVLLLGKFWAFNVTRSQAVFSDAMESIVNVVAAGLAIVVLMIARKPADKEHPYGHGKAEYFSAAFEGGLIAFASLLICVEAVQALLKSQPMYHLSFGVWVVAVAGIINAILGLFLIRMGKTYHSAALESSGHHVLSDFWTSFGVVVGLGAVSLTGWSWIDPVIALVLGLLLSRTGLRLVRRSIGGLMDEEDRSLLNTVFKILGHGQPEGIIQVHHLRVMRSGHYHHIDAHAVVPEFWNVAEAHERTQDFETYFMSQYPYSGELHLHIDPCRRSYCQYCDLSDCPIRVEAFVQHRQLTLEEIINPEEPEQFGLPPVRDVSELD